MSDGHGRHMRGHNKCKHKKHMKEHEIDENNEFEISLDCDYIVAAIRAFNTPYVKLQFTGEVKPMYIRSDDEPNLVQVVTPLRILN